MKEEQKVSFIHSISAKIMLLTVLAVVMSVSYTHLDVYKRQVMENVRNFKSEIGVLYLNDFNEQVLMKIIREKGLEFEDCLLYTSYRSPVCPRR